MRSLDMIPVLECVPLRSKHPNYAASEIIRRAAKMRSGLFSIEMAVGLESITRSIFDARNVPDELEQAYALAFSDAARETSLHQHYLEMLDRGTESTTGFISALKGKLFETHVLQRLEAEVPGYSFQLAESPIQPSWDIIGVPQNAGDPLYIQVKTGEANYASEIVDRMHEDPNVLFAVSADIREQIATTHPQLVDQLIDIPDTDYEIAGELNSDLSVLAGQMGIDIPDGIGEILPYAGEIILGIKLLCDIRDVERDFVAVRFDDRGRIHAMKAIMLLSRFGVSTVCVTVCGAVGAAVEPTTIVGGLVGAATGAYFAYRLNRCAMPHIREIAMRCAQLTEEDLFYFRNKIAVDRVGASLLATEVP